MKVTDRRQLPNGRLALTVFGLGCSTLGGLYRPAEPRDAGAVLDAAWTGGLRYFDTAPYYGYTRSEHRVGSFLADMHRADFVVSTKVGRLMKPDAGVIPGENGWAAPLPFRPVYDYAHAGVMRSFEDSLQRLGLERIDLLFVHDIGEVTHGPQHAAMWEQLTRGGGFRALETLRRDGRIAGFALGVNEWQVIHASMQEVQLDCSLLAGRYTLLEQDCLTPFLDACVHNGHCIVIGGAFNSGVLAGNNKFNYSDAPASIVDRVEQLARICKEFDVPLQAAALQFPVAHPAVVSCVVGARTAAQSRQNIAWFEQAIPAEFWMDLRESGLLAEGAPTPVSV